jgi:hypothetical protein
MQEFLHEVWQTAIMRLVKASAVRLPPSCSTAFTNPKTELGEKNMKALNSICITAILTLSLAASVAAGELTTPGYTVPPPPPPPESNITVDQSTQSTLTVTISDQDPVIAPDVTNDILWLLASIF